MKTVRLAKVISEAGIPVQTTLWTDPEKDSAFKKAIKEGRVMTLNQENVGQSRDSGSVGFESGSNRAWLVFPKSLSQFKGQKVIGINYDLIENAPPIGALVKATSAAAKATKVSVVKAKQKPRPEKVTRPKAPKLFVARLRYTSSIEIELSVQSMSRKEAIEMVSRQAKPPDMNQGTIARKLVKISVKQ